MNDETLAFKKELEDLMRKYGVEVFAAGEYHHNVELFFESHGDDGKVIDLPILDLK